MIDRDLAGRDSRGFPNVVRAGPFLFSRACDGGEGDISAQCTHAYGSLEKLIGAAGSSLNQVIRLDHFTESQGWLAERQKVRAHFFGLPGLLASTGVASRLRAPNMLSVAAIALVAGESKQVLVDGASFGMPAISTAVAGGGYVFLSGILKDGGYPVAAEPGESEFSRQARGCFATIDALLRTVVSSGKDIVRQDVYVSERVDSAEVLSVMDKFLPKAGAAIHGAYLPFGGNDLLEVTTLARGRESSSLAGSDEARLTFLTAEGHSPRGLVEQLQANLKIERVTSSRLIRLDVCLPSLDHESDLLDEVCRSFGADRPVVVPLVGRAFRSCPFSLSAIVAE